MEVFEGRAMRPRAQIVEALVFALNQRFGLKLLDRLSEHVLRKRAISWKKYEDLLLWLLDKVMWRRKMCTRSEPLDFERNFPLTSPRCQGSHAPRDPTLFQHLSQFRCGVQPRSTSFDSQNRQQYKTQTALLSLHDWIHISGPNSQPRIMQSGLYLPAAPFFDPRCILGYIRPRGRPHCRPSPSDTDNPCR